MHPWSMLVCEGGTSNKSSSLFTQMHDCSSTRAIIHENKFFFLRLALFLAGFFFCCRHLSSSKPRTGLITFRRCDRIYALLECMTHMIFSSLFKQLAADDVIGYLHARLQSFVSSDGSKSLQYGKKGSKQTAENASDSVSPLNASSAKNG